jgi:hypothetical protein
VALLGSLRLLSLLLQVALVFSAQRQRAPLLLASKALH